MRIPQNSRSWGRKLMGSMPASITLWDPIWKKKKSDYILNSRKDNFIFWRGEWKDRNLLILKIHMSCLLFRDPTILDVCGYKTPILFHQLLYTGEQCNCWWAVTDMTCTDFTGTKGLGVRWHSWKPRALLHPKASPRARPPVRAE